MRAYLIEPQTIFVPYLVSVLRAGGIEVIATRDDVDAQDLVNQAPDAIFVDIDFFDRGGPSTLCRIREVARRTPIVAISNVEDATFEATCYISGANAFVAKSEPAESIIRAVRSMLAASARAALATNSGRALGPRASAARVRSRA